MNALSLIVRERAVEAPEIANKEQAMPPSLCYTVLVDNLIAIPFISVFQSHCIYTIQTQFL